MSLVQRRALVLMGLGVFCLLFAGRAYAASGNADGVYTVTVTRVEISNDGGSTFQTIFSGSQSINIASVSARATAASLANGVALAPGTYNRMRTTIGSTLSFKGYVNNGATTIYTSGGANSNAFSTNGAAANTPGNDYTTSTFTISNPTSTKTVTIVVSDGGAAPTIQVAFDTSSVLTQSGGIPSLGAPTITITSS